MDVGKLQCAKKNHQAFDLREKAAIRASCVFPSVVDPHLFQCRPGSSIFFMRILIQIQGFDEEKLEKIYS